MIIEIYGDYVDGDAFGEEISPKIFREQVAKLEDGEDLEIRVNSMGGSVTAGIAIANTIRELSKAGHKTVCVIDGVAASIASITAMACDEIKMYPSSFLMIHNPWTMLMGDANTLRKEADTLDKMRQALVSFYRSKFDLLDEDIIRMMDGETWISGSEAKGYNLDVTLMEDDAKSLVAAKAMVKQVYAIRNNRGAKNMIEKEIEQIEEEIEKTEETPVEKAEGEEIVAPEEEKQEELTEEAEKAEGEEEAPVEPEKKEPTVEELQAVIAELEEKIKELEKQLEEKTAEPAEPAEPLEPVEPVEARVAKCQSVFQKKINDLKSEMHVRDEELQKAKAAVSHLEEEMQKSATELAKAQAAEADAKNALANLTGGALTSPVSTYADKMASAKTPAEREKLREMKRLGKIA